MKFSLGLTLGGRRVFGQAGPGAAVPAAFAAADWAVADLTTGGAVRLTVTALPPDGGAPITAVEYRVDGGPWQASGLGGAGSVDVAGLADGTTVSLELRAVNAVGAGAASGAKTVSVSDTVAPSVGTVAINTQTGEIDMTGVSEAGTYFGLIDGSASPMAGAAIEAAVLAGTPAAYLSFPVVSGANAGLLDKAAVAQGPAWLHGTIRDAAGNFSPDVPLEFTQPAPDTVAPVLVASTPANGAANVAPASDITLDFSETVRLGAAGTVVLADTGSGAVVETFDVASGQGDAGGALSVTGARLRISPGANFANGSSHALRTVAPGAVLDMSDNAFAGWQDDDTVLAFTTQPAAAPIHLGNAFAPNWAGVHVLNASSALDGVALPAVFPAGRIALMAVIAGAGKTIDTVSIDGVAAVEQAKITGGNDTVYLFDADIAGGGTGDIVVTHTGSDSLRIAAWNVGSRGFLGAVPVALNNTNGAQDISMVTQPGDAVVAGFIHNKSGATSWTGLGEVAANRVLAQRLSGMASVASAQGGAPEVFGWDTTSTWFTGALLAARYG